MSDHTCGVGDGGRCPDCGYPMLAWADSLTRGRRVVVTTGAVPVLSAFADWASPEDAVYDQTHERI